MAANDGRGSLELWFESQDGKTRLTRRRRAGPLAVQRTFYPQTDASAHVYLLRPAGACQLEIDCHLAAQAQAVLTTPRPTMLHRSRSRRCELLLRIDVAEGAICEYLPQETIVVAGADSAVSTRAELAADAVYIGWDVVRFARSATADPLGAGRLRHTLEIMRDGEQIWFERCCVSGPEAVNGAPFALAGEPIIGTLVYAGPMLAEAAARIRDTVNGQARHVFSVNQMERVVVCRYLGDRMSQAKSLFGTAWNALHEAGLVRPAGVPRSRAT